MRSLVGRAGGPRKIEITDVVPSRVWNFDKYSVYNLNVHKGFAEFYVQFELVAVIVYGKAFTGSTEKLYANTEPYSLLVSNFSPPMQMPTLQEISAVNAAGEYIEKTVGYPLDEYHFTAGQPLPVRQFSLYKESSTTKWSGLDTGGTKQTSHPVPIAGYPNKTVYFKSDAAGTLDIEVYVNGGWEVYDSITPTANELEYIGLPTEMQAPLLRCVYTPTDADTINLAEVNLS